MNVPKNYIFVGVVVFIICTSQNCKAEMVIECPNSPITPYPPVQHASNPGTVQPINPCQTTSPNICQTTCYPPVMITPINPCQTACGQTSPAIPCQHFSCPTTPTNPCPGVSCPNQKACPCQITCGQTPAVSPCQNSLCPTTSTNPCANQPAYPSQMTCGQTSQAGSCQNSLCPTTPTNPCPAVSCQNQLACSCPERQCQTPTIAPPPPPPISTTTPTPTTTYPPPNLTLCPPGTILIGNMCHIIYCPPGSVMKDDRCVFTECPEGTIWTGHRCSVPEPTVHNFSFNHTITTYINKTTPDIIINSTKNIVVNAPVTINEHAINGVNCNNAFEDCDEEDTTIAPTTETIQNCCEVMTPRICEERNNRWHCYSRRSRRCGDFCIAPIIYLKPPRIYASPKHVIMPPIQRECESYGICGSIIGGHDCSGCSVNNMSRCSYYCYRYTCPSQKCNFFDQKDYCANNRFGMFGCQMTDGCHDEWCLSN